jgi:putative oxidoreductase
LVYTLEKEGKDMLKAILKTDGNAASFFIRIALGVVMFPHGAQKAVGWFGGPGIEKTIEAFGGMGFPVWSVLVLMAIEFLGSIGLAFGFLTRLSALGIGTTISICAYMNHIKNGFFMNWFGAQKGEGFEFHILVVGIALALVFKGGGFLSIDRVLAGKK